MGFFQYWACFLNFSFFHYSGFLAFKGRFLNFSRCSPWFLKSSPPKSFFNKLNVLRFYCTFWYISVSNTIAFLQFPKMLCLINPQLSTAVPWREKICKHFVFYKSFFMLFGLLKSRISEKTIELLLNKLDFKLFHYKARVQPVSKITTIATRNRC